MDTPAPEEPQGNVQPVYPLFNKAVFIQYSDEALWYYRANRDFTSITIANLLKMFEDRRTILALMGDPTNH